MSGLAHKSIKTVITTGLFLDMFKKLSRDMEDVKKKTPQLNF